MEHIILDDKHSWVVLFGLDEARIIEARCMEDALSSPSSMYRVSFIDLKYRYLDLGKEAAKLAESIKKGPDPGLFYSKDAGVEKILSLPECKDKNVDPSLLKMQLDICKSYPEHIKQRHIHEYDLAQKDPAALEEEIKSTMEEHRDSAVLQIEGLKPIDFASAPSGSLSFKGMRGFPSLETAINELYASWSSLPWQQAKAMAAGYDYEAFQSVLKALQHFFDQGSGKKDDYTSN